MKKRILYIIFYFSSTLYLFAETTLCKNAFSIPTYPGTEEFNGTGLTNLNPPFGTILKVFSTKDHASLDTEAVVKFYKEYYESRGWIKGIRERRGDEPYLGLRINVYDRESSLPAGIQVAGDLSLWIAPQDGMLTVYMSQWRNSSLRQAARDVYRSMEDTLKATAKANGYKVNKAYTYSNWPEFYENEYLVDCNVFSLNRNSYPPGEGLSHCLDSRGRISVTLLAYKDAAVAGEVAKEFENQQRLVQKTVVQTDNILVLFENRDESQTNMVSRIAEAFKK